MKNKLNFDSKTKQRIFQQIIDLFVIPEIERRKKVNKLSSNLKLKKIQIIFSPNGEKNYVRLNEEVKAIIKCKVNKLIKKGDLVCEGDIDEIESIELTEGDLNYGHFTLLYFKDSWIVAFNFVYNKKEIEKHIEASIEFYKSAEQNLKRGLLRPFFENSFASAELSTKSIILSLAQKEGSRKHDYRKKFLENWANLGNVKPEFSTTLSKLHSLRSSARYVSSDNYKSEKPEEILSIIKEMINFSKGLIGLKKEIIIVSERDRDVFDTFLVAVAGGLIALGIQDIINKNSWGWLEIGISFLLIALVSKFIRKTSDTKK